MVHKMHQVFVGTLKKSGMHNVSRLDTNHILKEIGINPDKNAGIEWTHLQKLLRVWRRYIVGSLFQDPNVVKDKFRFDADLTVLKCQLMSSCCSD